MSTYKYLDESGLTHVHSLIDTNKKLTNGVEYIVGTQTADTNAWTGVSTDIGCKNGTLYNGKVIIYHLPKAGTSSSATLNLTLPDGTTTGAKTIYRLASSTVTTTFASGCDILMVWNGTNWKVNAYVDSNTNTIGYQVRTNSALWKNKTGYSSNRYTLLFEVDGGLSGASTTIATGTSKTPVNFKYIPGGVIKYYSVSGAIANNSNFSATGLWDVYTANLGYTFNTGSTLTAGEPVYMRCSVNSDGTLTPNYAGTPSHPIVQELPNTANGYVYVYLGQAYSTTNIELLYNHPIYEYKDGKIRQWQYDSQGGTATDVQVNGTSITSNNVANLVTESAYNSSTNKIATKSDIPTNNNQLTNGAGYITSSALPTKVSDLENDAGYTNNVGTITGITMNGSSKGTSGVVDLGTVITAHQNIKTINNNSLVGTGNISLPTSSDIPTKTSDLNNDSGFITGISSSDVTTALGYTPYNSTNPNNYISGITKSMVTTALGYTPYNSTNPNGYTSNTGTITGVSINSTSIATSGVADIKTNSTYNASTNKIATMNDLPSVPSAGTSASAVSTTASGGSATTYSKSDHVHSISSSTITSALGYTPYNSTNPNGYTSNTGTITGVSINNTSIATSGVANLVTNKTYNASTNKIATMEDISITQLSSTTVNVKDLDDGYYVFDPSASSITIQYYDSTTLSSLTGNAHTRIKIKGQNTVMAGVNVVRKVFEIFTPTGSTTSDKNYDYYKGYVIKLNASTFIGSIKKIVTYSDIPTNSSIVDLIYPVGSIYMSVNNTSPATLFGGTWVQLKDQFLLGAGDTYTGGATGGSASHTLSINEMPAHTHNSKTLSGTFQLRRAGSSGGTDVIAGQSGIVSRTANGGDSVSSAMSVTSASHKRDLITIDATHEHDSVGGGTAFDTMPPYLAVYMWKRTA